VTQALAMNIYVFRKKAYALHGCLNGMLCSGLIRHLLRATNTQAGPSVPQHPTLLPNFNSLLEVTTVEQFQTLLMRSELVMGHANRFYKLAMHRVTAKFMPRTKDAIFLFRVITVDESWTYGRTLRQSNNPHKGKVQTH
jgi:hypothetical protein